MKKHKIIFWITTGIIFLFEGVLVALTSQSKMSVDGIMSLGYPRYFVNILAAFKVAGSIALILPQTPKQIKEWAYAGFGIDFICAALSIWAVAGFGGGFVFALAFMVILGLSYNSYHKLNKVWA